MIGKTKKGITAAAVAAWAVLHFYTSVRAFTEKTCDAYTAWSWAFLGLWLMGLLALDLWLYYSGEAVLLRNVKWFWGFAAALEAVLVLGTLLETFPPSFSRTGLALAALMLLAPVLQLRAFSWLLFCRMAGLNGGASYDALWLPELLFCLLHFIYFAWLHRRARQRGETARGPVDSRAGTVE